MFEAARIHRVSTAAAVLAASAFLAAQAPAANGPSLSDPDIESMCKAIVKEKTDAMGDCRQEEGASFAFVTSWLQYSGLLNEDGAIDMFKLADAQSDPLSALDNNPAATASFCLGNSPDWISLGDCINALDQDATYKALGLGGDPDGNNLSPTPDDGLN